MLKDIKSKYTELAERKRAELEDALENDLVAEPISITAIVTSLAISAAVSTASYFVSRAFAPKPPKLEQGRLTGSLQLQNSEQGIFIPEIYGAGPAASIVTGSNPTYQNLANVTAGSNGSITKTSGGSTTWNAGASHNVSITSGQDAFFEFIVGTGYAAGGFTLIPNPTSGNTDFLFAIQWNPDSSITIKYNSTSLLANVTHWTAGDKFRVELRAGRFRLYKGSAEIVPQNFIFPTPSYPLYMGIAMQVVGAGISNGKVQINSIGDTPNAGRGGVKVPAIIVWTSGIRKNVSTSQQPVGGGKGGPKPQTVENISYDIDLGLKFARGPLSLIREYANTDILIDQYTQSANPSGVYDPGTGEDPTYDPTEPPDPKLNYITSIDRVDGDLSVDGFGVATGTIQGGGSTFTIYPGSDDQPVDPVIEADTDAKYGAGSTPAYRNHSLVVHSHFSLSRWGGIVPNITSVWEHETLKTLDDIYGSFCERAGVLAANGDYDLSGIAAIASRGLLISGRPFQPAEIIDSDEIKLAYNYFPTEAEGQIIAFEEGAEPSITISDTEIGWLEGDDDLPDILPELDSALVAEINLAREVTIKSIDPDNDWDPNTANAMRQVTDGQKVELLEIQITQLSDERRATAQRALYRQYVRGSAHKFTLPWTYLYLYPGYKIIINRAEGFTHTLRLEKIVGGIGVLECEATALEPETFNQPANGVFPPGYVPPQQIPAMTIVMLLDTSLLRDGDITNNNGVGQYVVGTPRTGVNQNWQGFALYIRRNNEWTVVANSNLPGTFGTIVSAPSLSDDPTSIDNVGQIVVDLYGTTAILTSVAEADITRNMGVAGNMVFNFATATQVAGFPNRWTITKLLNGIKNTVSSVAAVSAGDRFVFIDNAVVFYPLEDEDINTLRDYRAVSVGQSLEDSAIISQAYTGNDLREAAPSAITGAFDLADGSLLVDWVDERTIPLSADRSYELEIRNGNPGTSTLRGPLNIKLIDLARVSSTPPLKSAGAISPLPSSAYTWIGPGGFDANYTGTQLASGLRVLVTGGNEPFLLDGGCAVEFQVPPDFDGVTHVLPKTGMGFQSTTSEDLAYWTVVSGMMFPFAAPSSAYLYKIVPNDRFAVIIQPDGSVAYYINYIGATSDPWFVSPVKLELTRLYELIFTYQPDVSESGPLTVGLRNIRWLRNLPEFAYAAEMQKADNGGSLPSSVHLRVRTLSPHPLGPPSEWTYATFVRP